MTKILVIRHGPTDWNEAGLIQGHTDRPLSEAGREQIAAMRLPDEWVNARCLSSPLRRAIDTARLLRLDPKPEPRLIEMAWGEWEGKGLRDLRAQYPAELAEKEAEGLDFRPPGGESPRDVQVRLGPLLSEVRVPTIFVTHKGVLRALYALATGWDMTSDPPQKLHNGRAHSFESSPDGTPSVDALNIALTRQ
jgi:2,3-bisphosphoglycerate-dependent phosphoglycerate mutase